MKYKYVELLKLYISKLFQFCEKYSFLISLSITLILFFLFFPLFYGNNDEHCYLRNAWNIPRGGILYEDAGEGLKSENYGNGYTSICMLGTSVIMTPFTIIGWQGGFIATIFTFCIAIFFFNKILRINNISSIFTILFALFPAFVYFERTLFSEIYSMTSIIIAVYFFQQNGKFSKIITGIALGFSFFVRYTQIIIIFVFELYLLWRFIFSFLKSKKLNNDNLHNLIIMNMGLIPWFILSMAVNYFLWGGILKTGYNFQSEGENVFSLNSIISVFPRYFLILNITFPGMLLLSAFGSIKKKWVYFYSAFLIILFYSIFDLIRWEGRFLDFILYIRYIVPIIPILLLLYFSVINKLLFSRFKIFVQLGLLASICILFVVSSAIHYIHQNKFLKIRYEIMNEIKDTVPDNSFVIGQGDDYIYLMEPFNNKYYEDVEFIDKIEDSKSELIIEKDIYLVIIKYPDRGDTRTQEMLKFQNDYQDKLDKINDNSLKYIEVYKMVK